MATNSQALPQSQAGDPTGTSQLQRVIAALQKNPIVSGRIVASVALSSGDNTISHGLGRALQGWIPVRIRGAATLYDKQDANSNSTQTLVINSSAQVTADIYVF